MGYWAPSRPRDSKYRLDKVRRSIQASSARSGCCRALQSTACVCRFRTQRNQLPNLECLSKILTACISASLELYIHSLAFPEKEILTAAHRSKAGRCGSNGAGTRICLIGQKSKTRRSLMSVWFVLNTSHAATTCQRRVASHSDVPEVSMSRSFHRECNPCVDPGVTP